MTQLMGILNAEPDSFSDPGRRSRAELVARGIELAGEGAAIVDVGGESGRTDRPAVTERDEIARVAPLVERLAAGGLCVSVDTWRAPVARAALAAGAAMINDVSALSDPLLAEACAEARATLVIAHTRLPPKRKGFPEYADVMADVIALLSERVDEARRRGVTEDRIVLDPGLDLAKTPTQSIELLRRLPELCSLGYPVLVAASRKDFIGALTGRAPAARDAGTLAAVDAAVTGGASILRVHDVAGTRDYLAVREGMRKGESSLMLDVALRREPDAA